MSVNTINLKFNKMNYGEYCIMPLRGIWWVENIAPPLTDVP